MKFKTILLALTPLFLLTLYSLEAFAKNLPVFLVYHRFGETTYPSTNTTLEQLDAHIKELSSERYNVLPISEIIAKMRSGVQLDDRTIGISIDDGYLSIYRHAWPRLKAAGLPFTIFVSTAFIGKKNSTYLTWGQVREMEASGVSIGHHTHRHIHMAASDNSVNEREISIATKIFEKELEKPPVLFSYPFGEMSLAVKQVVKNAGFQAAFGQHSGVLNEAEGFFTLPRFALNENFGTLERFKLVINSLSLNISEITPTEHLVSGINPPLIGFTLNEKDPLHSGLQCFTSHDGRSKIEMLGANRVEIRVQKKFPKGRTRLNCTSRHKNGRWRWFGRMFFLP